MLATGGLLAAPCIKLPIRLSFDPLIRHLHVRHLLHKSLFGSAPSAVSTAPARRLHCSGRTSFLTQPLHRVHCRVSFPETYCGPSVHIRRTYSREATAAQNPQDHHSDPQVHLSSIGGWTFLVAVGFVTGAVCIYHAFSASPEGFRRESIPNPETTSNLGEKVWSNMTGELLPGRPGNLTPDQEEKLRELWIATLQVFGVLDRDHANEVNGNSKVGALNGPNKTDTGLSEKPKKRRIPFMGRKHKSDADSTTSSELGTAPAKAAADPEDKYGQTKQFHDTLAQQSPELLRATFWSMVKHDHPDALLLRFLRARKWDVEKALIMMISTMNWRATEVHVDDDVIKNGELAALLASQGSDAAAKSLGEDFLAQMRMGKSYLHGTDKSNRPMCFVRVRLHKQGEQSEASLERYTVFLIETARMVLAPPVDTACVIFDMTGFSLANMDYSPVKFMIKCFEANYPESLGVVLVHKAPWVFQGIWKIIRGWLDPVVASKVNFTNSVEDMEQFVAKSQIPKELGGDEDWSYAYIEPAVTENDAMKDSDTRNKLLAERETIVKQYEEATLEWIDKSTDADASTIKERRFKLAADLKADYWKLDPFVRARSLYDRYGVIQKGGNLQFYPPATPPVEMVTVAADPETINGAHATATSAADLD